jgi:uncharacterized membrane protein
MAHEKPIPSKVTVMKHPIHPMVVVFPIAFLTSAFLSDLAFWWLGDEFWALASFWLATGGFVMGVFAAFLGMADFFQLKQARSLVTGWSHFIVAIMALALAGTNVGLRWNDPVEAALPWGIFVSAVMALMVGIAGWLGGSLTFEHGIGTYEREPDGEDERPPARAGTAAGRMAPPRE